MKGNFLLSGLKRNINRMKEDSTTKEWTFQDHMDELDAICEEHFNTSGFMACNDEQMTQAITIYLLTDG